MINTTTLQGPYVFISYPRHDEMIVKRLVQDLQTHGFQVWRDETNIDPGSPDWETAIRDAIRNAYAILLIASPGVTKSLYVKGELNLAKRYHPNRIYPLWMDGTEWSDCVPIDFINTQYIDMRAESYTPGLNTLVKVLRKAREHSLLNKATPQASMPDRSPTPVLDTPTPTYAAGSGGQLSMPNTGVDGISPPLPHDSIFDSPQQTSPHYTTPTPGTYTVPSSARAQKRSRAGLFAIVLLLVLVLGGVGGYFAFFRHPLTNNKSSNQNGTSTAGQHGTPSSSPTTTGPMMEQLNLLFTYASVEYTITSVQEAQNFPDDSTAVRSTVRINLIENNPTTYNPYFFYSDVAHLVLPDGTTTSYENAQHATNPGASTSRTNWIDFAIPSSTLDLSKLVLRMGTPTEHQMEIPLLPNADLSKYQAKTTKLNVPITSGALHFTLVTATASLSSSGKQASIGMRYIILLLWVDNPTSQQVLFISDDMRLKSGNVTNAKTDTTLPSLINPNTTGVTGTVSFLMPENDTAFTLTFLPNPAFSSTQVNTDFQFQ